MNPLIIPVLGICCGMLAVIGGVFIKPWLRLKERQLQTEAQMVAEKAAQYAAQVERLEARVRVLEQIATDSGVQTAAQIEALRGQPRLEAKDELQ
jgi:ABC-type phosphate transport system auxiliary subunit